MAVALVCLIGIAVIQRDLLERALIALITVLALGVALSAISRRGHTRTASALLVAGLVALVTLMALSAGGMRSPGATMYFVFVMMAGLLLGPQAGAVTAAICALLGGGLVASEYLGVLPPPVVHYSSPALWILACLYMAVALSVLRLSTAGMEQALHRAEGELAERRTAEADRETLIVELGERVKELQLLHGAARLLQHGRPFEPSMLKEIVSRIPPAWKYPEVCVARITWRGTQVATPGWRESEWTQSETISTTRGTGMIEVAYLEARPPAAEGPFLAEERSAIKSLADMLTGYLERDDAARERRALEDQLRHAQKMEALGTLAGGIAHDFNNILTAIGGNAELGLVDLPDGHPARESFAEIFKAHNRARDLVKRILLFSRRQDTSRERLSLTPIVEDAAKLLRASLPPMIDIRTRFEASTPVVLGDATQIHQIVMNLGTNAAHAMAAQGGELSIVVETVHVGGADPLPTDLHPGDHICLTVSDNGVGMSREVLDRCFEPFFTTKGHGGTGLGLSVVHGIVREHQGAITIDSQLGHGSTFRVYFPASDRSDEVRGVTDTPPRRGHGEHVMYVDDEEAIVLMMARLLERLGYRCTGFTNAPAALQAFRTTPDEFNAVITDFSMPGMTGAMLVDEIRKTRPNIPIAVVSGSGDETVATALDSLSVARLAKPVALETIGHVLAAILGRAA
jgi:signal transduction histidine kinase